MISPRWATLSAGLLTIFVLPALAWAHVSIRPTEAVRGSTVTYTVRVPSEGSVATTSVELEIPDGVVVKSVEGAAETYAFKKSGSRIAAITCSTMIPAGQNAEFMFSAENPKEALTLFGRHTSFLRIVHAPTGLSPKGVSGQRR